MKEETKHTNHSGKGSAMGAPAEAKQAPAVAEEETQKPSAAPAVDSESFRSEVRDNGKLKKAPNSSGASASASANKVNSTANSPRKQESGSGGEDSGGSEGRGYWASGSSGGDDRNSGPESDESASDEKQENVSNKQESVPPSAAASGSMGNVPKSTCSSYEDCSKLPPLTPQSLFPATSSVTKEPTFPVKLHMMLANPDFHEIITWLPHGRSWRILKQKDFENQVLPMYFR